MSSSSVTFENESRGYPENFGPWQIPDEGKNAIKWANQESTVSAVVSNFDEFMRNRRRPSYGVTGPKPPPPPISGLALYDPAVDARKKIGPPLKYWIGANNAPLAKQEQKPDDNAFIDLAELWYGLSCLGGGAVSVAGLDTAIQELMGAVLGDSIAPVAPVPVGLEGRLDGLKSLSGDIVDIGDISVLESYFSRSEPLGVFTIARGRKTRRHSYKDGPKIVAYSYAQAQIYNTKGMDLYTQDWRARLVPASFLNGDGCSEVANKMPAALRNLWPPTPKKTLERVEDNGKKGFVQFTKSYQGLTSMCEGWADVIVH